MIDFDVLDWTLSIDKEDANPQPDIQHPALNITCHDFGVIEISPKDKDSEGDKAIVLSCAVHGNETAPIELLNRMLSDIFNDRLQVLQPTLFLFANPWSIMAGERFVETNMNRLFSGAHEQGSSKEHQRAAKLEGYVRKFFEQYPQKERIHYDLHTAIRDSQHEKFAVYPFQHGRPYSKAQLTFLAECGIEAILLNQAPTTTFSYFSVSQFAAHGFTVELGKVRPFGQNDMSRFSAVDKRLRELVSQATLELPEFNPKRHKIYDVCRVINRTQQQFRLNFPDDVANFTEFKIGDLLACDGDTEYRVEQAGERIVFPNAKVEIGQRALLMVAPLEVEQLPLA